jgi:integrase
MQRLKAEIAYTFEETARGAIVRISTRKADARAALHEFLTYQIQEHATGDPVSLQIGARRSLGGGGSESNRTINMDVGVLSRVLKFSGRWRALADHVKNLPERQRPIGRALTSEERRRLFDVAASNPEWEHVYCAAIVAANTSMRAVEVKHIRRCDVDLVKRLMQVRRSKNETSHRVIPLNASAIEAVARMLERADLPGHTEPGHYLWPACQWGRYDPTKPMLQWDTAWRALRDGAGLHGLRSTICGTR